MFQTFQRVLSTLLDVRTRSPRQKQLDYLRATEDERISRESRVRPRRGAQRSGVGLGEQRRPGCARGAIAPDKRGGRKASRV